MEVRNHTTVRIGLFSIGLFGIGLEAYWPQFEGLKQRLEGCIRAVHGKLERPGVELVNLGLIDSPEKTMDAGHRFRREDVDLIFLHVTTYALSSTVLPVVQRAKVPVIVLNLTRVHIVQFSVGNVDKRGNAAAQVHERMQLDRRLGFAKVRPGKQRQTEVNRAGVQRVQGGLLQFPAEVLVDVQPTRPGDEHLSEIGVDAPVAHLVGVGEGVARDRRADAHVIQLRLHREQARLDVAQRFAGRSTAQTPPRGTDRDR